MQTSSCQGEVKVCIGGKTAGSYCRRYVNETAVSSDAKQQNTGITFSWGCKDNKVLVTFQEKGHLWVLEWVQASKLSLEVECFGNLFWVTLQSYMFYFFLFYWLQLSCGIEIYWIAVLKQHYLRNKMKKLGGIFDCNFNDNNVCFFCRTEVSMFTGHVHNNSDISF